MNFNELKDAIHEGLDNGTITESAANRLLAQFENADIDYDLDMALNEAAIAESSFMESAVSYSTADESYDHFVTEAKTFADKVKKAWEAFKKWVKELLKKLERKIEEFKAKITGKSTVKVTLKYNLKKVSDLLSSLISKLRNVSAEHPVITGFVEMIAGLKAINYVITGQLRDKLVTDIRKQLFTISSMLDSLESKLGDTKIINVIRPVINVANAAVLAAYPASSSKIENTIAGQYYRTNVEQDLANKMAPDIDRLQKAWNDLTEDSVNCAVEIQKGVEDPKDLEALKARMKKNTEASYKIIDTLTEIGKKFGIPGDDVRNVTSENIQQGIAGKFIATRVLYTERLVRTETINLKRIINKGPYDGQDTAVREAIAMIREHVNELTACKDSIDKLIASDPKDKVYHQIKTKYEKSSRKIDSIMKDVDRLETIAKQRHLI